MMNSSLIEGILNHILAFVENSDYFVASKRIPIMSISNNPIMQGVRGAIGKQLVFRTVNGKQIVSSYPDMSDVKRSRKQKKQNSRMKEANVIVKAIKSNPEQRNAALLRLDVPSNKLHHALLKEQMLILSKESEDVKQLQLRNKPKK